MSVDLFIKKASKTSNKLQEMTEDDVINAFEKHAKMRGALVIKLVINGRRGFPDRTVMWNGIVFFIEFKRPSRKNNLSSGQVKIKNKLESQGCKYFVCWEIGQAERILDEIMDAA